jgi:hypothetical protein
LKIVCLSLSGLSGASRYISEKIKGVLSWSFRAREKSKKLSGYRRLWRKSSRIINRFADAQDRLEKKLNKKLILAPVWQKTSISDINKKMISGIVSNLSEQGHFSYLFLSLIRRTEPKL